MVIENKKLPGYGDRNCRNELCFIDQEKVDDWIPREVVEYLEEKGITIAYVWVLKNAYGGI